MPQSSISAAQLSGHPASKFAPAAAAQLTRELDAERSCCVRPQRLEARTFYYGPGVLGSESYGLVELRAGYDHQLDPSPFAGSSGTSPTLGFPLGLRY